MRASRWSAVLQTCHQILHVQTELVKRPLAPVCFRNLSLLFFSLAPPPALSYWFSSGGRGPLLTCSASAIGPPGQHQQITCSIKAWSSSPFFSRLLRLSVFFWLLEVWEILDSCPTVSSDPIRLCLLCPAVLSVQNVPLRPNSSHPPTTLLICCVAALDLIFSWTARSCLLLWLGFFFQRAAELDDTSAVRQTVSTGSCCVPTQPGLS